MSLRLDPANRTILLAAHPDDETIGSGAMLASFPELTIIHATDGAPLDMEDARRCGFSSCAAYADARRQELHRALEVAEADHARLVEWKVVDKQAAYEMPKLARLLVPILGANVLLLTHPYEGGHPDHDACAFVAHAAARLCGKKLTVVEFTSYHAGPGGFTAEEFLGAAHDAITVELTEVQKVRKRRMLECFSTQIEILSQFPVQRERFRLAPPYDFTKPPHEGQLLYERYGWEMTGPAFCALASQAMHELGLQGAF
jgi:LmbE family N-acetylglucosaminyl deacetylase